MAGQTSDIVIIGGGVAGMALAAELTAIKAGKVIVLEKGYIGSGNSTRNVGRVRAPQLTEKLTKIALKCQKKYDALGEELGFNILFRRGGYAWLLTTMKSLTCAKSVKCIIVWESKVSF